jgi:epoxyqueuosine reductase
MDDSGVLRIDCEECVMQATSACDDCVVTFLCGDEGDGRARVVDLDEVRTRCGPCRRWLGAAWCRLSATDDACNHDRVLGAAYVAELRRLGQQAGLDAVGVAPAHPFTGTRRDLEARRDAGLHGGMAFTYRNPSRSTEPDRALPGVAALVVAARAYEHDDPTRPSRPAAGRVAAYARADHYGELRAGLDRIAGRLGADGWRCRVVVDDNALVDREAAYRAGLGWYGKNANLLLPGKGSWFVLGSVLTTAPLPADPAPVADGCGSCRRCLDACPTGAIVAPGVVDARRCLAWLVQAEGDFPVEYREALGDRLYGCDDCQTACPINRIADRAAVGGARPGSGAAGRSDNGRRPRPDRQPDRGRRPGPDRRPDHDRRAGRVHRPRIGAGDHLDAPENASRQITVEALAGDAPTGPNVFVDVLELLAASDDELMARHGRWYIPRRDPRYLRRNALVVLGNVGVPTEPAVIETVRRYCADPDPMLREHARWAADHLGVAASPG